MRDFVITIYAQLVDTDPLPKAGVGSDNELVINILNLFFGILAGIAFISILYGGFKYIISQGESDKIGKAKDIIMYSLIGLAISLSAFGIVNAFIKAVE